MIHGPDNKGNLNLLYNVMKKGVPWPLGAFGDYNDFFDSVSEDVIPLREPVRNLLIKLESLI